MNKKQWLIYIIECQDGSYYTGITNDIQKRMQTHKEGKGSKYVRVKGFSHLITTKICKDRSDASKAECLVKKLPKNKKIKWFE
jgi:putative endonuclease